MGEGVGGEMPLQINFGVRQQYKIPVMCNRNLIIWKEMILFNQVLAMPCVACRQKPRATRYANSTVTARDPGTKKHNYALPSNACRLTRGSLKALDAFVHG